MLVSQLGRDLGRKKEKSLFAAWGGKPTTRMLRHRDADNQVTLQRRHQRLKKLLPEITLPSPQEEHDNPGAADDVYETCSTFLREHTRDKEKFRLVFEELCNYGFRRNLWGMKSIALFTSILSTAVVITLIILTQIDIIETNLPIAITCGILSLFVLVGWIFLFKPNWVRVPAEAYAIQLLSSIDKIEPPKKEK